MDINFEPVERVTVSEEIIKKVISLINSGKLKPGSKLPSERELMEQLKVSRSSVREALHSLTMVGLLETFPGAGTFVSRQLVDVIFDQLEWSVLLGKRELVELMEVREPLEIQAAGLAAQRASAGGLEELRQIIEAYHQNRDDIERQMDAEMSFHRIIAEMAGNRTLVQLILTFQGLLREYRKHKWVGFAGNSSVVVEQYKQVLSALEDGDEDRARQAMAYHLQVSKQLALVEQINASPSPGSYENDSS
ncbi:MAG: FadR family transcriptional regulator [Chloroflexi bacterium]|nr:FadR family transcriptional regulator [Chloroflexota bacterium]